MTKSVAILLLCLYIQQGYSQCRGNDALFEGACVKNCPITYINSNEKGFRECKECLISNFEFPNKQKTSCQCSLGYYRTPFSGACQKCHYTCLSCKGPAANDCTQCSTDQISTNRVKKGQNCVCLSSYFDDSINQNSNCLRCHQDCETCSGPEDNQCLACSSERKLTDLGFCICPSNLIPQSDGSCICPEPYLILNGQCVQKNSNCGPNQVPITQKNSNNGKGNNKKIDQATELVQCQCRSGFVRVKSLCTVCGLNENYNQKSKKCQCVNGAHKFKNQCILCPEDKKYDRRIGKCLCKNKNLFQSSKGECIRCQVNEALIDDKCECVSNYIRRKNGKCGKCSKDSESPQCSVVLQGADKAKKLKLEDI